MTPAVTGEVLHAAQSDEEVLPADKHAKYRTGVGKLLHMMRWSRPEVLNSVRELTKCVTKPVSKHLKALYRVMGYMVNTPNRGRLFKPDRMYDGSSNFKFRIKGGSDSDYAKEPVKHRSVSGCTTKLEGVPVICRSRMQQCVTLSVTEAEVVAGCETAQDMMFTKRIVESIGFQVELPMLLEMDNKGAVEM